jgi:hypothetical protein
LTRYQNGLKYPTSKLILLALQACGLQIKWQRHS